MRYRVIHLCLCLTLILLVITVTTIAATISETATPTETPAKVTITPGPTPRIPPGEVVFPITPRVTPTRTVPQTTVPVTPATPQITVSAIHTVSPTTIPRTTVLLTPTFIPTTVLVTPVITRTTVSASPTSSPTTIPRTTVPFTPTFIPTTVLLTPVITQTTASASPTVLQTTIPVVQGATTPGVTVTPRYYRSGPIFSPEYIALYTSGYPTGSLTVTSNPSDAVVILDGINSETTPYVFTGLTTGYHTVEVDYPGYEAYIHNVYVDTGADIEINADLIELVNSGSLFVESTPPGADVYVDGNYQGTSPVTVGAMSAGNHQVELHLAGYDVLTSTEYVAAGQVTVANLVLIPDTSLSPYGSIDITSTVPGALVYLDGIYKGTTQSVDTFNIISVDPGSHTLLLHVPGYSDFQQTVQVNAGQISDVNAVFSTLPVSQQGSTTPPVGSIIVTSSPSGSQVYVDNQFRGVTPVTIYNVAPGNHIINLKLAGYSDYSTSVDVPANQIVQVPATFIPGSGGTPVPTRAGLTPVAIIVTLVIGLIVISSRFRK
jgi:hypothetical protein